MEKFPKLLGTPLIILTDNQQPSSLLLRKREKEEEGSETIMGTPHKILVGGWDSPFSLEIKS